MNINDIVLDQTNDRKGRIIDIFLSPTTNKKIYQLDDLEDNCYWFAFEDQLMKTWIV